MFRLLATVPPERLTERLGNRARVLLARAGGAEVSRYGVILSHGTTVAPGARVLRYAQIQGSTIGVHTVIGQFVNIFYSDIAAFSGVAWGTAVGAGQHDTARVTTHDFPVHPSYGLYNGPVLRRRERVTIESDVWIGCEAVVLPGVRVRAGAVVGAGAVVTKDVDPYEIVAGVPARHVRYRFPQDVIDRLLEIRWWDWSPRVIAENVELFRLPPDPDTLARLENVAKMIESNSL